MRGEAPTWWIKHEETDRAARTKMRQLCLCTASTSDLVVKLVDITRSPHTWLQHESVARLVIRCAPIYVAGGMCSTLFLEMNATFPFKLCCCKEDVAACPLSVELVCVQLLWWIRRQIEATNYPHQMLLFVHYKWFLSRAVKQSSWRLMECKNGATASNGSQSSQWCSHLFTVIILISQN